jgi:hypothetical protein
MLKQEKIWEIAQNFASNKDDVMDAFRKNCFMILEAKCITLREWAELADISFSTLNSFLYGNSKTCDINLPIRLAGAIGVTVDELLGSGTMSEGTRECVSKCRRLPTHFVNLARSYIRHIFKLFLKTASKEPRLVILPECRNGHLQTTNVTTEIDVSHLEKSIQSRIAHCLCIPCDHYEPYFMKDEIILLAVDRDGQNGEICVISHGGEYYIVRKKSFFDNGIKKWKYISLFTEVEFLKEDIEDKLGYVIGFLYPDRSWGER